MKVSDFDFELPEELVAQTPLPDRTASKLLQLERHTGTIYHRTFSDLIHILESGDTLVLNNTKVLPARLFGVKEGTGAKVEVLLLNRLEDNQWEVLVKPGKKVQKETNIHFGDGLLQAECTGYTAAGGRILRFTYEGIFEELLDQLGQMPLPPYIKEQLDDRDRYQTVYAQHPGSAAAPTAGLHFTVPMLEQLEKKGINVAYVTLHVGLGTFRPVSVEHVEEHDMHAEYYQLDQSTANQLNKAKAKGNRIIAVGTTSARTLEAIIRKKRGRFEPDLGWTDIFMYPGFSFEAIDGLITNFHLPRSTLLMLVSALAGREQVLEAYRQAISRRYRFFSFGDAMIIL